MECLLYLHFSPILPISNLLYSTLLSAVPNMIQIKWSRKTAVKLYVETYICAWCDIQVNGTFNIITIPQHMLCLYVQYFPFSQFLLSCLLYYRSPEVKDKHQKIKSSESFNLADILTFLKPTQELLHPKTNNTASTVTVCSQPVL